MTPAHELLYGLPEVTKYLGYDPRRLARAQRAGTSQVGYEFLMRLHCARHPSRMADFRAEMQDSCPLAGRNLAYMRLIRHMATSRAWAMPATWSTWRAHTGTRASWRWVIGRAHPPRPGRAGELSR